MADEDHEYTAWLRTLPCCACGCGPDYRPIQAHHTTGAGMGLRAHDHEAMPLCAACHRDLHDHGGRFRHMTKQEKMTWQREKAAHYREMRENEEVF